MTEIKRLAIITALAQRFPKFGRTALMKYCYFLQVLRDVPLEYRFTLYSYGPFDSDVLADLDTAESVGAVTSSVDYFQGGYGYRIEPGARAAQTLGCGGDFIQQHDRDLEWLQQEFGGWSPGKLELASTLVYSDREAEDSDQTLTIDQLAKRVNELKPRYHLAAIQDLARHVKLHGQLNSVNE